MSISAKQSLSGSVKNKSSISCKLNVGKASDGEYERGYEAGYVNGNTDGYASGYEQGLLKRTYEVWTITYADGSVEDKEVALL